MALKTSRLSKLSLYIIVSSITVFTFLICFLIISFFFPVQTISNNFSTARSSRFIAPWPISALEQENLERRRLKRYAKSEQLRRMEKQLQRMEILNTPIYDLFLDSNAEISNTRFMTSLEDTSFLWPMLPAKKLFYNSLNPNVFRKSSQVVFPYSHWSRLIEGIILLGGEEIKATIPVVRGRRSFNFTLFLLTPGSIRINLGQYIWAKTFTEDDVQKRVKFSIPINDSTATNIKIISISSSFYILDASVNHTEHNARSPIRVSSQSKIWNVNKTILIANQKKTVKLANEDETILEDDEEVDKFVDEQKPEDLKPEELPPTPIQLNQPTKKSVTIIDPLTQITNPQIMTDEPYSTAFGYNIVIIQTPKISESLLKNRKKLAKISPTLNSLLEQSAVFSKSISISENSSENFRRFIFSDSKYLSSDNIPITREEVDDEKEKNTYLELRKYGYDVVGIANPETYFFNKQISESAGFSNFYGRWLEKSEWAFSRKNMQIDDRNLPVQGLDAIFKTKSKDISPSISQKDFQVISSYLSGVSQNIDAVPNWGPNEYILINNQTLYIPRTVEAFQNWTQENQQSRFLAHILLDTDPTLIRPTLKDLGKSISTLGFSSIVNPFQIDDIARVSYIDRALGQIMDTIKARKIENRTIVFILQPLEKVDSKKGSIATGILKIPGLIPKKNLTFENLNINDITATLLTNVGIPVGKNIANKQSKIDGYMLENIKKKDYEENIKTSLEPININKFFKYTLLIKPDAHNCASFLWNPKKEQIFGVQTNYPVNQIILEKSIEFFPCSIKNKFITFTWYQKNEGANAFYSNIDEFLGGSFSYRKNITSLPYFYFGNYLTSSESIPFYFDSVTKQNLEKIFIVDEKNLKKSQKAIKDNFYAIDIFEGKNLDNPTLTNRTKIGFFVTPL
ncbi:hypothetical protein [Fluviispira multicolorata]|uniref:Uncharacterized protein n=1 Tax=Fluviispira multicolorata TaxID=2654512 RepID=A0A833JBR9_9BACT|nr:hypothetical protein [Fluviispira multicolorata]KAB8029801.1 hypothetical protein GCL57_09680 [Fluviispira multicolorata]